jgi:HEAT repeat protein
VELVRAGDESSRAAAVGGLDRFLDALPDGEPRAVAVGGQLLDAFPGCDPDGQRAILELLPVVMKKTGNTHAAKCRTAVASALKMLDPAARVLAARLAIHPDVKMRAEVVPLLSAPEAEVRRAALFAASLVTDGDQVLGDEELFRWLHDPDEGVRRVCRDALVGRDRSETDISLGRRLTDPDPLERLKLLLDLRYDDDVADPDPWLERLSRDPEPAVRAGAARVAVEVTSERKLACPVWVHRVADADSDPTVRRVATFFRRQYSPKPDPNIIPAGKQ